ncbi:MAG: ABC transporter permease [Actinomycetota bacterium]|nr:ABC transporter permease [Actinomycetota bacterium]
MKTARLLGMGWLYQFKQLSRSQFDSVLAVLWPLFFATVAFFMFRQGGDPDGLIYAALGAAVMGIWSATSMAAGTSLQRERWLGTLELLVAAPAHFGLVLLPVGLATATIGAYCMATTLLWGRFVFGIDLPIEQPLAMAVAIPATLLSIGALGFLFGIAFARYRYAWALGSLTEYPMWLICGFLVPLTLLPPWVPPISWLLAPTWGMSAIRESSSGGSPLPDVAMCVLLGAAYVVAGILLTDRVLRAARVRASLSLT